MSIEVESMVFAPAPISEPVPLTEWRALFHDSPLAIAYVSRDLRLLRVNGPLAVLCGRMAGELLGRHCYEVFGEKVSHPHLALGGEVRNEVSHLHLALGGEVRNEDVTPGDARERPKPCSFCRVRETLRTGDVQEFERPFGQSTLRIVASPVAERRGEVTGAVLMMADVTAERQFKEQVIASQRLAAVGIMTSGVAHELRNPLTSVLGFAQLLRQRTDLPEGARGQLERIWSEARRCDHIVNSLLKFTRRRGDNKALVDVNRVVLDSLDLLRYPIQASRVRVNQCLHAEPLQVVGHFCELQQVVQNIVNNALDALRETTRSAECGVLTLRTYPRDGWAVMEFENDGPPLAEPHRLFQPFYTTKEAGRGTGLGLSVSHAIVRDHGGRIEAMNVERGVLFRVALRGAEA